MLAAQDGEELRCLILEAIDAGWCGPAAEVIARSLVLAADTRLSKVVRQGVVCSRMSRDETVMDTISWTWEALRESTGEIVGAGSPWAMWTVITERAPGRDGTMSCLRGREIGSSPAGWNRGQCPACGGEGGCGGSVFDARGGWASW